MGIRGQMAARAEFWILASQIRPGPLLLPSRTVQWPHATDQMVYAQLLHLPGKKETVHCNIIIPLSALSEEARGEGSCSPGTARHILAQRCLADEKTIFDHRQMERQLL